MTRKGKYGIPRDDLKMYKHHTTIELISFTLEMFELLALLLTLYCNSNLEYVQFLFP